MTLRPLQHDLARAVVLALALATTACGPTTEPAQSVATPGEWREFEGTWSATGTRRMIPLGGERKGSIVHLEGTMLLSGTGRPGVGFRAEVIALGDTQTGLVGRGVWTDERGDQVFSEIKGEGTATQNHIEGTLLGGTGRYAGVTGGYEFSWQFVIESEDGSIQGRATGLKGRFRLDQPGAGSPRS